MSTRTSSIVSLFASSDVRLSNAGKKPTGGFHKKLLVGTLEYMAPEILTKTSHTRKSDVYSLSILLNECVTGTFPFSDCHKERPGCHTVLELGYGHQELKAAVAGSDRLLKLTKKDLELSQAKRANFEAEIEKLHSKIGQLVVERDFLANASVQLLGTRGKKW